MSLANGPDGWATFARELGHRIHHARVAAGMSQDRVAYRANLSRYTYQKYEKGESRPGTPANPTVRSLLAIAQALEVDLEALLPDTVPDLTAR